MTASGSATAVRPGVASHGALVLAQAMPVGTIAWGALAFGAVYPWAYWPLAAGCIVSGLLALAVARGAGVVVADRALRLALMVLAAAMLVQLVPLPTTTLGALSPKTPELLENLNPAFAAGLISRHPISVWPRDSFIAFALFLALALFLIGMARLLAVTGARRTVEALTTFAVLLALIGIVQKPLYNGAIYGVWQLELGRLPFGPFVNRNHFAGWMVMVLPLTLALVSAHIDRSMRGLRPGWRHKVLWFSSPEASQLVLLAVAAIVMALSLVLTMSRSGIVAFILSLVAMTWFVSRALDTRPRKLAAATCLGLLLIVVFVWVGPDTLISRFASGDWGEFNNRRGAWRDAWSVMRDFPLAGTGLNTYWAASLFYQRHELTHFFAQTHNDYIQIAAEGGFLVTVPALVCLGVFARDLRRAMKEERGSLTWWLRAGAVTSLLAIACQETVEFSLQMPGNAALFALVCAIALHRPPPSGRPQAAREPEPGLRLVTSRTPRSRRDDSPALA